MTGDRTVRKAELLEEAPGLTPIIRVGNFFTQSKIYYSDLELAPKHYCNKGDLLFAWSASFGPKIWEGPRSIFHYHIWKIEYNPQYLDCKWLYYWLEERSEALKSSGHGIAMIHITKQEMEKKPIAVPPLEEQRRIVAKLEELKPLVDQFGEAYDKLSELEADFPRKLKASILQAAMQGKLVPQLDCEPAVEQIGPALDPDDVPFELPEKWQWVRMEDIVTVQPKVTVNDDEQLVSFVPMEKVSQGFNNDIDLSLAKPWRDVKNNYSRFADGDVIFAKITSCFQNHGRSNKSSLILSFK